MASDCPTVKSTSHHRVFAFASLVLGFAVALLLGEGIVRIFDLAPAAGFLKVGQYRLAKNEKIGWEPNPDFREGLPYDPSESNAFGYRDADHTEEKPPGVYRVLILGDSLAMGYGIERYADTFPGVLDAQLRAKDPDVEVLNFGVNGYNTQQEVELLLKRGLAYQPDLVLLQYCLNDTGHTAGDVMIRLLRHERRLDVLSIFEVQLGLLHSELYRFVRFRFAPDSPTAANGGEALEAVSQNRVAQYFRALTEMSRDHSFEVLVAVFPVFDDLVSYRHHRFHEDVGAAARRNGFHHLDLYKTFRACGDGTEATVALDPYHPSELGHRCSGFALADFVQRVRASDKGLGAAHTRR